MPMTDLFRSVRLAKPSNIFTEYILAKAWLGLADDQLLNTVWPGKAMLLSEFLEWCSKGTIYAAVYGDDSSLDVAGLGWATGLEVRNLNRGFTAEVGMAFRKRYQATEQTLDMARFMIQDGFENLAISDMYGVIPVVNAAARNYANRMGFTSTGVKKGHRSFTQDGTGEVRLDCEIFEMSKEHWAEIEAKRRIAMAEQEAPPWVPAMTQLSSNSK